MMPTAQPKAFQANWQKDFCSWPLKFPQEHSAPWVGAGPLALVLPSATVSANRSWSLPAALERQTVRLGRRSEADLYCSWV
jgi:hypothetical protein